MKTRELIRRFCQEGLVHGSASNKRLRVIQDVDFTVLVNYRTPIAMRDRVGNVILNTNHYSTTTTKHQNRVREYADELIEEEDEQEFWKRLHLQEQIKNY